MEEKNIISALKRLERAGSEHSRTTKKLKDAATTLAVQIERLVPAETSLPRGYEVVEKTANNGGHEYFLSLPCGRDEFTGECLTEYVDGIGGYLFGDLYQWIEAPSRKCVLEFARDVATGWLEEVATWLEKRGAEDSEAAAVLERAAQAMEVKS